MSGEASNAFEAFRFDVSKPSSSSSVAEPMSRKDKGGMGEIVDLLDDDEPSEKLISKVPSKAKRSAKKASSDDSSRAVLKADNANVKTEENLPPNSTASSGPTNDAKAVEGLQLFPLTTKTAAKKSAASSSSATTKTVTATKPKPMMATTSRAINATKTKIFKDLEKLSAVDRASLIQEMLTTAPSSDSNALSNGPDNIPGAQRVSVERNVDEDDLVRLRLELGEVLNREAELRAKEKKLRVAIKKLQRKITMGLDEPSYQIKEDSLEVVLSRLFGLTDPNPWEVRADDQSAHGVLDMFANCPLWRLAQQRDDCNSMVEEKRVDANRDATILSPVSDLHPSQPAAAPTHRTPTKASNQISALSQIIAGIESPAVAVLSSTPQSKLDEVVEKWSNSLSTALLDQNGIELLSLFEDVFGHSGSSQSQCNVDACDDERVKLVIACYTAWRQALRFDSSELPVAKRLWVDYTMLLFRELKQQCVSNQDGVYVTALVFLLEKLVQDGEGLFASLRPIQAVQPCSEEKEADMQSSPYAAHCLAPANAMLLQSDMDFMDEENHVDIYDALPDYDYEGPPFVSAETSRTAPPAAIAATSVISSTLLGIKRKDKLDDCDVVCLMDDDVELNTAKRQKTDEAVVLLSSPDSPHLLPVVSAPAIPHASSSSTSSPTSMSLFERLKKKRVQYQSEQVLSLPRDPLVESVEPAWHLYPDRDLLSIAEQYGLATDDNIANLRKLLKSMWKTMNATEAISAPSQSTVAFPPSNAAAAAAAAAAPKASQAPKKSSSSSSSSAKTKTTSVRTELTVPMFKDFLNRHIDIYQDILMFIPISVDVIHARLLQEGIKVTKKALLIFLDAQAIFVAMRKNTKTTKSKAETVDDNEGDDGDSMSEVEEGYDEADDK